MEYTIHTPDGLAVNGNAIGKQALRASTTLFCFKRQNSEIHREVCYILHKSVLISSLFAFLLHYLIILI